MLKLKELAVRFDNLEAAKYDELARALWQLWAAFLKEFTGLDGFLASDDAVKHSYLRRLSAAADRFSQHRDTPKGHYHLAVASMLVYVEGFLGQPTQTLVELSARVAKALDRGRSLEQ